MSQLGIPPGYIERLRRRRNNRIALGIMLRHIGWVVPNVTKAAMAKVGYARCSSASQDYDTQVAQLKAAGCDIVRAEKVSGKSREGRDELASILEFIRPDDELVVVRLDRLGRATRDVLNLVHELEEKGAALTVLEPGFSTKDAAGHLLVTVLGMVASLERTFLRDRQRAGIEAAKSRKDVKVYKGRKAVVSVERVQELAASGLGPTAIAAEMKISRMHAHRLLKATKAAA